MTHEQLINIIEAALFSQSQPLTLKQIQRLFHEDEQVSAQDIRRALHDITQAYEGRGVSLVQLASGYRFQVPSHCMPWVQRLSPEKPPRFSRAFLETLAVIIYRQPVTRGDIEQIRGVSLSSMIMKTLQERGWIREVGVKDVPGKPSLWGTTKAFLDYFNLRQLSDLPPLQEILSSEDLDDKWSKQLTLAIEEAQELMGNTEDEVSADVGVQECDMAVDTVGSD